MQTGPVDTGSGDFWVLLWLAVGLISLLFAAGARGGHWFSRKLSGADEKERRRHEEWLRKVDAEYLESQKKS